MLVILLDIKFIFCIILFSFNNFDNTCILLILLLFKSKSIKLILLDKHCKQSTFSIKLLDKFNFISR